MNQPQRPLKILLLGDQCTDRYVYGTVTRISPEAPVPVFVPEHEVVLPGMAANVQRNLHNLGAHTVSVLGEPSEKTRMVDSTHNHQLLRIDRDTVSKPISYDSLSVPEDIDGIVISDYNKGSVTRDLLEKICKHHRCGIYVDTKKTNLSGLEQCIIKVNKLEASRLEQHYHNVIVTQGGESVLYAGKQYAVNSITVCDVTGAGDTFLAALAVQHLHTQNLDAAIEFAIAASAVTVQHSGVYAPTTEEVHHEIARSRR